MWWEGWRELLVEDGVWVGWWSPAPEQPSGSPVPGAPANWIDFCFVSLWWRLILTSGISLYSYMNEIDDQGLL